MLKIRRFFYPLTQINTGYRIRDKLLILFYGITYPLLKFFNKMLSTLFKTSMNDYIFPKVLIKNSDGVYLSNILELYMVSEEFEKFIRKYFKNFRKGVFIDVGSYIGKYTIMIAKQTENIVISIEQNSHNFERLKKNISLNKLNNVIPLNVACWNKNEIREVYDHNDPGLFSLVRVSKKYYITKCQTLDKILSHLKIDDVDLIKIDVEGAEPKVLEGAKNILKRRKTKVIFEAWNQSNLDACKEVLKSYRYKIKNIDGRHYLSTPS